MKTLSLDDLDDLAIGSAILGSGGGGDPTYFYMMAKYLIEKNGPVTLIGLNELNEDDMVLPVGFIGAPLVEIERIPSGSEFTTIFEVLKNRLEKNITSVMPYEIGGALAFSALMAAAQVGIPILDADMMGRAFPEFKMTSCHLAGIPLSPAHVTDTLGNTVVIDAKTTSIFEKIGFKTNIAMGSSAAIALRPLTGAQAAKHTLSKSISRAIAIGKTYREAKKKGKDPLEAILTFCKGCCIGSGKIRNVIPKGFLSGIAMIQNENEKIELLFQNEYLLAKSNGKILATTPDILILLERDTGTPITSERLQFGLDVHLVVIPAPSIWTSAKALELVGPRHFGYDFDYQPMIRDKDKRQQLVESWT